jgi:hypothetical protein
VNIFPLPLNKKPGSDHGDTRQGWILESGVMQLDSPNGGVATFAEMRAAGLRYLVVEFKENPPHTQHDFSVFFQGNQVTGVPAGTPFRNANNPPSAADLYNRNATPDGTRATAGSGWFGDYITPSSITAGGRADGAPAKVSDTLYAFDFGVAQGSGHFPAKWNQWAAIDNRFYFHPGYSREALYLGSQIIFETAPLRFEHFLENIERAYFTNMHPGRVPKVDEVQIGATIPSIASPPALTLDTTGHTGLKLHYNGELTGIDAVRLQYSIDGGITWINIHQDFSIITASGARSEILPVETYDQPDLRIRWIPHGVWGSGWNGGSYTVTNVRLTTGLQHGERPRRNSPVLYIGSFNNPPTSMVQRISANAAAPAVALRQGAPANTSTGVLWSSGDATIAKVAGGEVRALRPGVAVIRASSIADRSIYTEFTVTITPGTKIDNISYVITNPYAGVNWDTFGQYKASLHNHTRNSDGAATLAAMAEHLYDLGFNVVAFTDHNRLISGPTAAAFTAGSSSLPVGMMTPARVAAMAAGAGRPGGTGMLFIPGTNEDAFTFDEASPGFGNPGGSHDFNTFWSPIARPGSNHPIYTFLTSLTDVPQANWIDGLPPLIRANHPGRYTGSYWPIQPFSDAEAIANDAAVFMPYVDLFLHEDAIDGNLIGMEIVNKMDAESQADRILWDNILSKTMPDRPVWGFSDDDAHSLNAVGFSYNIMLMDALTLENVHESMSTGSFFAFSRADRQYAIYPAPIQIWDWDGNRNAIQTATGLPVPEVDRITVGKNSITIDAVLNGAPIDDCDCNNVIFVIADCTCLVLSNNTWSTAGTATFIDWYADGVLIHRGKTLDLLDKQLNIYNYVRATIVTPFGVLYTQPFGVEICGCADGCCECDCICECKLCHDNGCVICFEPCIDCGCCLGYDDCTGNCICDECPDCEECKRLCTECACGLSCNANCNDCNDCGICDKLCTPCDYCPAECKFNCVPCEACHAYCDYYCDDPCEAPCARCGGDPALCIPCDCGAGCDYDCTDCPECNLCDKLCNICPKCNACDKFCTDCCEDCKQPTCPACLPSGKSFGDIDGDGKIDSADVTLLRRYIAAEDKAAFEASHNLSFFLANARVTGGQTVTAADVTMLRRWIASPEKFPLGTR